MEKTVVQHARDMKLIIEQYQLFVLAL